MQHSHLISNIVLCLVSNMYEHVWFLPRKVVGINFGGLTKNYNITDVGFYVTSAIVLSTGYLNRNHRCYLSTGHLRRYCRRYLYTSYLKRYRRHYLCTGYLNRYRRRYRQCFVLPSIQTCLTFGLPKSSDRKNKKNYSKEFSPHLT